MGYFVNKKKSSWYPFPLAFHKYPQWGGAASSIAEISISCSGRSHQQPLSRHPPTTGHVYNDPFNTFTNQYTHWTPAHQKSSWTTTAAWFSSTQVMVPALFLVSGEFLFSFSSPPPQVQRHKTPHLNTSPQHTSTSLFSNNDKIWCFIFMGIFFFMLTDWRSFPVLNMIAPCGIDS